MVATSTHSPLVARHSTWWPPGVGPCSQFANETRKLKPPVMFVVVGMRLFSAS
jgi:hypothetical protein